MLSLQVVKDKLIREVIPLYTMSVCEATSLEDVISEFLKHIDQACVLGLSDRKLLQTDCEKYLQDFEDALKLENISFESDLK